jgi:hypothetical protein
MINNETKPLIRQSHPGFIVAQRWHFSLRFIGIAVSILYALFVSCQSIALVLFLSTFNGLTGAYFVLFISALAFSLIFSFMSIWSAHKKQITPSMRAPRWLKYILAVAVLDAANGFLSVFSSHGSRVPPALTSILTQATIPLTFVFSKVFLGRIYYRRHVISVGIVLFGIAFSLVPIFKRLHDGTQTAELTQGWYWPFISVLSCLPGSLMNIVVEKLQTKYTEQAREHGERITRFSVIYFQAIESTFQFLAIALGFAFDIVPGFGTSTNIRNFWLSFTQGFQCFFNASHLQSVARCSYAALTGFAFIFAYQSASLTGTFLTDHVSANWLSILSSISPLLSTSFWFIFPSVNQWAHAAQMTSWDIAFNLGALPIILIGMFFYRYESSDKYDNQTETCFDEHPIELFW